MEGRVDFRDGNLKRQLREIGERAEDLTPLMDMIGSQLVTSAQRRISDTNTGPDGIPWPQSLRAKEAGGRPSMPPESFETASPIALRRAKSKSARTCTMPQSTSSAATSFPGSQAR